MISLQISPQAQTDLMEIQDYISDELLNPSAAINSVSKITEKLRSLIDFPLMGAQLSSIVDVSTDYRFVVSATIPLFIVMKTMWSALSECFTADGIL